jgi:hypothetical protein
VGDVDVDGDADGDALGLADASPSTTAGEAEGELAGVGAGAWGTSSDVAQAGVVMPIKVIPSTPARPARNQLTRIDSVPST